MTETIPLRTRDGRTSQVEADVVRTPAGARRAKAVGVAALGLILGVASIAIPIAHFVLPWLLPLLGGAVARHLWNQGPYIARIRGACPACGHALDVDGGTAGSDLWVRCPGCAEPLHPAVS